MEWNDETIARLRALWDEGLSTAEIGRRLGVSKNAVVGKAHRMMLPPRPSPIRRDGAASPRAATPRRVTGPTLPPLPATFQEAPAKIEARRAPPLSPPDSWRAPAAIRTTMPVPATRPIMPAGEPPLPIRVVPPTSGRSSACCWPLGDPGTQSFHFCGCASLPGKPYCPDHAQLAYVKVRDRREEAA